MKNLYLILGLMILGIGSALSQQLSGTLKNTEGTPLEGVIIRVLNTEKVTVSGAEGKFGLDLVPGSYQLEFSMLGFASRLVRVDLDASTPSLDVVLEPSTFLLDEAVVTATRREEEIIRVPTSISSLSSRQLENTRTWGLNGLSALVPNYYYQELGVPFQQIQSIRGIMAFSENPAVATYIDDVNNLDILANGFMLTDVERIEVLRGPQGTLFGRNAMGGVINIITKQPSNTTSGFAEISAGNLALQRYAGGFKTPLVKDKLFLGINGLYQSTDGYLVNDTTGTGAIEEGIQGQKVGGEKNLYGNLSLRWLPSTKFSLAFNAKVQRDWSDNTGFFVSQTDYDQAFESPEKIALRRIGDHERIIWNTSLVAKYLAEDFTLTSITAYQNIALSFKDIDFAGFPGFFHSFYQAEIGELLPPQEVLSQEFRITSDTQKRLTYTAGLYGFSQVGFEPSTNTAYELPLPFATFLGYPNGASFVSRNKSDNYGFAGYGELGYELTSKLKATAGIRYDYESRKSIFNGFGDAILADGVVTDFVADTTASGTYSAFSPKIALAYALTEQSNAYVSYSRGFRAGGVNAQRFPPGPDAEQTFDPEFSDNFELGYKAYLANQRVSLRASAFWISWQDLQFFNVLSPLIFTRDNVGDASSRGIELEVSAIPVKGLQLDANLGLNKTEYGEFDLIRTNFLTQENTTTPIGGNALANAPSSTLFLAAQYELPLGKKLRASFRGETRTIGEYFTDIQNNIRQPSYTLLNSRIGLVWGNYSLFFWGQNLTDTTYLAFGTTDSSSGVSIRTAAPRTLGFTLSAKFD